MIQNKYLYDGQAADMEFLTSPSFLNTLFDGVYYVDRERKINFWNKAAEKITGYKKEEVVGSFCYHNILRHIDELGNELCLSGCPLHATIKDGVDREHFVFLHHKDGYRLPVFVRATPIRDESGKITGAIEVFQVRSDVDISRGELEKYKKESLTDTLTNTGNRRYAELVLQTRFYQLINLDIPFGLIFIDLDDFKLINDQFGHLVGDEILKMVSRSVMSSLRVPDIIIRWGGDEFLVILPNITQAGLEKVVNRIQTLIRSSYLMVKEEKIGINLSLGATLAVADDTQESLIERADQLMYQSKQSGKNQVHIG